MPTQSEFVGGAVENAVNETIGDLWPGAHVAAAQFDVATETWLFTITTPPVALIKVPAQGTLQSVIDEAEYAVAEAKAQLLAVWGFEDIATVRE